MEVKAWVVRERRYPSSRKTPAGEGSMRQWLRDNLPGNKMYTPARRKKLNDAFGEGWEAYAFVKGGLQRQLETNGTPIL